MPKVSIPPLMKLHPTCTPFLNTSDVIYHGLSSVEFFIAEQSLAFRQGPWEPARSSWKKVITNMLRIYGSSSPAATNRLQRTQVGMRNVSLQADSDHQMNGLYSITGPFIDEHGDQTSFPYFFLQVFFPLMML